MREASRSARTGRRPSRDLPLRCRSLLLPKVLGFSCQEAVGVITTGLVYKAWAQSERVHRLTDRIDRDRLYVDVPQIPK